MNKCFIVPLQASILMEENDDGEAGLTLHVALQLLHLRLDHQVNRFMGCDCHIEMYHKVLKSGFHIEHCRLGDAQRLIRYVTVMSIIAWRLFLLTLIARTHPEAPCTTLLTDHEWKVLYCKVNRTTVLPLKTPPLHEAIRWIARLGGFLARKNDGRPGTILLWRGWKRLTDLTQGWRLATGVETCG